MHDSLTHLSDFLTDPLKSDCVPCFWGTAPELPERKEMAAPQWSLSSLIDFASWSEVSHARSHEY